MVRIWVSPLDVVVHDWSVFNLVARLVDDWEFTTRVLILTLHNVHVAIFVRLLLYSSLLITQVIASWQRKVLRRLIHGILLFHQRVLLHFLHDRRRLNVWIVSTKAGQASCDVGHGLLGKLLLLLKERSLPAESCTTIL